MPLSARRAGQVRVRQTKCQGARQGVHGTCHGTAWRSTGGAGLVYGGGGARRGHGAGAGAGRTGAQGRWGRAAQSRGRRRRNGAAGEAEAGGGLHHEGTRQGSVAGPWVKHASAAMRHAAARPLRPCHAMQGSRSWGQRRRWPEPLGKPYVHAKDLPKNRKTGRCKQLCGEHACMRTRTPTLTLRYVRPSQARMGMDATVRAPIFACMGYQDEG